MPDWKRQLEFDHQRMKDAAACQDCEVPWPCEAAQALNYITKVEAERDALLEAAKEAYVMLSTAISRNPIDDAKTILGAAIRKVEP